MIVWGLGGKRKKEDKDKSDSTQSNMDAEDGCGDENRLLRLLLGVKSGGGEAGARGLGQRLGGAVLDRS